MLHVDAEATVAYMHLDEPALDDNVTYTSHLNT